MSSDTPKTPGGRKIQDAAATDGGAEPKPASNVAPLRKTVPCPECGRPSHREHYPFCSNRCRDLDLSRWLTGAYAIPVSQDEDNPDDTLQSGARDDE
nr:DNA gyrase inhibitor YacG [Rhizobium sp. Leaf341]